MGRDRPETLRNPLYHWTHLELKRPLGIGDRLLAPDTARDLGTRPRALARPEFSCRGIMRQMNVVVACTTDDPTDSLEHHAAIAADTSFPIKVLPTFRPDRALAVHAPDDFNAGSTGSPSGAASISATLSTAFWKPCGSGTISFIAWAAGSRTTAWRRCAAECTGADAAAIFRRLRGGRRLGRRDRAKFTSAMLHEFALWDHEKGWTQQFHLGALRNNNTRMFRLLGPDAGFDSIGDMPQARRWPTSSTASTSRAAWRRRSSTTSTPPTTKSSPR